MAISDRLEKLASDISDSYDAVEEKGGTLPEHKNTDSLPEAILSIAGGGPEDPGDWGLVYYWPKKDVTVENISGENCTATIVNERLFSQVILDKMGDMGSSFFLDIFFQQGEGWSCWELSDEPMTTEDLLNNVGIEITDFDESTTDYAFVMIAGTMGIDKSVLPVRLELQSEEEFLSLVGGEFAEPIVPLGQVKKYIVGKEVTALPDYFLNINNNSALEEVDTTYASKVTTIGDSVFACDGGYLTCNMDFPNVTSVGERFAENMRYVGMLNLPKVVSVGDNFGNYFYQLPYMPNLETAGEGFMAWSRIEYANLVSFPKLKTLGRYAFGFSSIIRFYFNATGLAIESIGCGLCNGCVSLKEVVIGSAEYASRIEVDNLQNSNNVSFGGSSYDSYGQSLSYLAGIQISGGGASAMQSRFPNKTDVAAYNHQLRKWRTS